MKKTFQIVFFLAAVALLFNLNFERKPVQDAAQANVAER
jgi:hypothetical protein